LPQLHLPLATRYMEGGSMDMHESLTKSIAMANKSLERIATLSEADRQKVDRSAFGTSKHTNAVFNTADEITSLRSKDKDNCLAAFLVDAEKRIADMKLDRELESLTKAAVRALALQYLPGREAPTRDLYAPFEKVIPRDSLA
jgi:hypothetical protein